MTTYSIPIVLSSDVESGANNKTIDGSSFSIHLERPIQVPKEAKYCYICCESAQIWNTVPNIVKDKNDKLYFSLNNVMDSITIEQGRYGLDSLDRELSRQLSVKGYDKDLIRLKGELSTNKVVITFKGSNVKIDFTKTNTFRKILGFDSKIVDSNLKIYERGQTIANFNSIQYFLIHVDLVDYGLRFNDSYSSIIEQVWINVKNGSQILSTPYNPVHIPCNELIGNSRNVINVWLTDEKNRLVNTGGENYTFRLVINYVI